MLGRFGLPTDADVEEPNQEGRTRVSTLVDDPSDRGGLDPELLQEFTRDRLGLRLPLVDLPAGKLPKASVTFMVGPPPQ